MRLLEIRRAYHPRHRPFPVPSAFQAEDGARTEVKRRRVLTAGYEAGSEQVHERQMAHQHRILRITARLVCVIFHRIVRVQPVGCLRFYRRRNIRRQYLRRLPRASFAAVQNLRNQDAALFEERRDALNIPPAGLA